MMVFCDAPLDFDAGASSGVRPIGRLMLLSPQRLQGIDSDGSPCGRPWLPRRRLLLFDLLLFNMKGKLLFARGCQCAEAGAAIIFRCFGTREREITLLCSPKVTQHRL
jgi:hypothetical protein